MNRLASRFAPVCQFKYYLDLPSRKGYFFNDYTKERELCYTIPEGSKLSDIVRIIGKDGQNLVYCSSRQSVLENAVRYARKFDPKNDDKLNALAAEIKSEVRNGENAAADGFARQ